MNPLRSQMGIGHSNFGLADIAVRTLAFEIIATALYFISLVLCMRQNLSPSAFGLTSMNGPHLTVTCFSVILWNERPRLSLVAGGG